MTGPRTPERLLSRLRDGSAAEDAIAALTAGLERTRTRTAGEPADTLSSMMAVFLPMAEDDDSAVRTMAALMWLSQIAGVILDRWVARFGPLVDPYEVVAEFARIATEEGWPE